MSEIKHTPGPWKFVTDDLGDEHAFVVPTEIINEEGMVVVAYDGGLAPDRAYTKEEAFANARLIAEAGTVATETGLTPRQLADQRKELLEACEFIREILADELLDCTSPGSSELLRNQIRSLDTAIAKAKGETSNGTH